MLNLLMDSKIMEGTREANYNASREYCKTMFREREREA
jgi:hypothetical protein